MTTSGTTNFNPQLTEIIQEAYDRAGIVMRSGYEYRSARRSIDIMMQEWANRGINLWTVEEGTQVLTSGTATYNLPSDTVDLIDHVIRTGSGTSQSDLTINRMSVSNYSTIPNKTATGRPIRIYVDRQITPSFTVWPVPDASQTYTLVYWRLRRIEDAGQPGTNTMDMPFRFMPALIAGLAYNLALKNPGSEARIPMLEAAYEKQWQLASDEDRSRASVRFIPFVAIR
jgi:hypothetical protein